MAVRRPASGCPAGRGDIHQQRGCRRIKAERFPRRIAAKSSMRFREQDRRNEPDLLARGDRRSLVEGLGKLARLDDGAKVDAGAEIVRMVIGHMARRIQIDAAPCAAAARRSSRRRRS